MANQDWITYWLWKLGQAMRERNKVMMRIAAKKLRGLLS